MIDADNTYVTVTSSSNKDGSQPTDALDGPDDSSWEPSEDDKNPYLEITPEYVGETPKINVIHVTVENVETVTVTYVTPEGETVEEEPVSDFENNFIAEVYLR